MKRELDPYTLRAVVRNLRMKAKLHSARPRSAANDCYALAAEWWADDFLADAREIEAKAKRPRKLTPATTLCGPVPATPRKPATKAKRKGRRPP